MAEHDKGMGAFIESALARGKSRFVAVHIPAPELSPLSHLGMFTERSAWGWDSPDGLSFVGIGELTGLDSTNWDTHDPTVGARVKRALDSIEHIEHPSLREEWKPPVMLGMAFDARTTRGNWDEFGLGILSIPELWMVRAKRECRIVRILDRENQGALGELDAELTEIQSFSAERGALEPLWIRERGDVEPDTWSEQVRGACEQMATGGLRKVVLSRACTLRLSRAIGPGRVLARLRETQPNTVRFAVRKGSAVFLGATPETLVRLDRGHFRTEALAGTSPRGAGPDWEPGAKERKEHDLVVQHIVAALRPFSEELRVEPNPSLVAFGALAHLRTRMEGELRSESQPIELVKALHPTPAVGGVPSEGAIRWIGATERHERGWYSGPLGWFDADGRGHVVVALRSGLFRGVDAWVYAGAGLVPGSVARDEYDETERKLAPLLEAVAHG